MSKAKAIHAAFKWKMVDGKHRFYGQTVCGRPLGNVGLAYITDDPGAVTCNRCRDGRAWQTFYARSLGA